MGRAETKKKFVRNSRPVLSVSSNRAKLGKRMIIKKDE